MKKAQGMPLNVIIIAVLVLIVLVVLVIIFGGRIGMFGKSTEQTESQFKASNCEIAGTGRYCGPCEEGDTVVSGTFSNCAQCCCCKYG